MSYVYLDIRLGSAPDRHEDDMGVDRHLDFLDPVTGKYNPVAYCVYLIDREILRTLNHYAPQKPAKKKFP
jgi:hypothetical protein